MATKVEPGQRSATLEPRTVKRAIAGYLVMAHGVVADGHDSEEGPQFTGITLNADGSAHVTLHANSKPFERKSAEEMN